MDIPINRAKITACLFFPNINPDKNIIALIIPPVPTDTNDDINTKTGMAKLIETLFRLRTIQ